MGAGTTGETEIAKALIRAGADVNIRSTFGDNALTIAAQRGHIDIVQTLLDAGADVSVKDMIKLVRTPLQDDVEAMSWARKAAEQGDAEGQYLLGFVLCCKMPSTVPQDSAEVYMWFTLAARGVMRDPKCSWQCSKAS